MPPIRKVWLPLASFGAAAAVAIVLHARSQRRQEQEAGAWANEAAAAKYLTTLPDDSLAALARGSRPADAALLTDEGMRGLYDDTLRRLVPHEQARRETVRAAEQAAARRRAREQAEREQRLR